MSTVKLVDENTDHPKVQGRLRRHQGDQEDRPRAQHLAGAGDAPGAPGAVLDPPEGDHARRARLDLLTKEIIALAVSATNGCDYCINSHTAAVKKLGLDNEALGEVLAVVGLYNQMNKLADAYQVEPDILPPQ